MSIDINKLRQLAQGTNEHSDNRAEILAEFYAATQSDTIIELLDRLEVAEKAKNNWLRANAPGGWIDDLRMERNALHARIKEMEQQEPVAHVWRCDNGHIHGSCEQTLPMGAKLYALPGAKGEEK